jgi:hypothetical protein
VNFGQMRAQVLAWIKAKSQSARLPDAVVNSLINLTVADILRENKLRFSEKSGSIAVGAGDVSAALPTGFIRAQSVRFIASASDAQTPLHPLLKRRFDLLYPRDSSNLVGVGAPVDFMVFGAAFVLGPRPEAAGTLYYDYDGLPADMVSDTETSDLMDAAWDVILFGTLIHASDYLVEDMRTGTWQARYTEAVRSLNAEHAIARQSGGRTKTEEPG